MWYRDGGVRISPTLLASVITTRKAIFTGRWRWKCASVGSKDDLVSNVRTRFRSHCGPGPLAWGQTRQALGLSGEKMPADLPTLWGRTGDAC